MMDASRLVDNAHTPSTDLLAELVVGDPLRRLGHPLEHRIAVYRAQSRTHQLPWYPCDLAMPRLSELELPIPAGLSPYHPSFNSDPPEFPEDAILAGRYRVHTPMCRGGMGELYRVIDTQTEEMRALKVLTRRRSRRHQDVLRFENEIRILHAVRGHPGVVELLDHGQLVSERSYCVMELLRHIGHGRERPDASVACNDAIAVASALGHIHRCGVVHRDVKPSNIVSTPDGPKLIDFGIAVALDEALDQRITQHDNGVGTLEYMPPEQFQFSIVDPASDFYSLGATLFEWLVGSRPFGPATREGMLYAKRRGTPDFSLQFDRLPLPLQTFVVACLAPDPANRIADEATFTRRLCEAMRAAGWEIDHNIPASAPVEVRPAPPTPAVKPPSPELRASDSTERAPAPSTPSPELRASNSTERAPAPSAAGSSNRSKILLGAAALLAASLVASPFLLARLSEPSVTLSRSVARPNTAVPLSDSPRETASGLDQTPRAVPVSSGIPPLAENSERHAEDSREHTAGTSPTHSKEHPAPRLSTSFSAVHDSPECAAIRKRAKQSADSYEWSAVIDATRTAACWKSTRTQRTDLRVEAFLNLGQLDRCVAEAKNSSSARARETAKTCRDALAQSR